MVCVFAGIATRQARPIKPGSPEQFHHAISSTGLSAFNVMGKFTPYLKTGLTVLLVLVVYKLVLQPIVSKNDTAAKFLPSV
jgi:hypothetical protein